MVKRLGVAVVVALALALLAFGSTTLADESSALAVEQAATTDGAEEDARVVFTLFSGRSWLDSSGDSSVVNLKVESRAYTSFRVAISNRDPNFPLTKPVVTGHFWSTGSLSFQRVSTFPEMFSEKGTWSLRSLDLERFELTYRPPEGGLIGQDRAMAEIVFYGKCGTEFAQIGSTVVGTPQTSLFNIGFAYHTAKAPLYTIVGQVAYDNGEVPLSGNVEFVTPNCGDTVARANIKDGVFELQTPLVIGERYAIVFRPDEEEAQRRPARAGSYWWVDDLYPDDKTPATVRFYGQLD